MIYHYNCPICGVIKLEHGMKETYNYCPHCDNRIKRVFKPPGIIFKDEGFYSTDNK